MPPQQRRLSQGRLERLLSWPIATSSAPSGNSPSSIWPHTGQLYWSDTHQLNLYLEDYHNALDHRLGSAVRGSEMITELYVPRGSLVSFMDDVRRDFRANEVDFIYGTIRLIEAETRDRAALGARTIGPASSSTCTSITVRMTWRAPPAISAGSSITRLRYQGSYFLTYHRFADAAQIEAAHPAMRGFLAAKRRHDPAGVFQSDWYRHLCGLFT